MNNYKIEYIKKIVPYPMTLKTKNNHNLTIHNRFVINIFSNLTLYGFSLIIGLWFTPYLIKNLSVAVYGLIPLATSVISYLSLITLSINGAVGRFLTIDIQKKNFEEANVTFNTALVGLIFIAAVTLPILLGISNICTKGIQYSSRKRKSINGAIPTGYFNVLCRRD